MSDNAYFLHASSQAKKIASKAKGFTPKERGGKIPPLPAFFNNIISRLNIEENIEQTDGPTKIIDVQPDFRNVVLAINYHITRHYADLNQKINPDLTPASMMAYCLTVVYGLALLYDDENARTVRSQYSSEFIADSKRLLLREYIARMYVPPFLEPILESMYQTSSQTRRKLLYVYSLAGFQLEYDYGRAFPVSMYLKAHDIIASSPTNQDPNATLWTWINSHVMTVPTDLRIGQLLGVSLPHANHLNWFAAANFTLFNPVTARSNTTRPTFKRIPVIPFNSQVDITAINPYIYLLNATPQNVTPMTNFIKTMSDLFTKDFPGGKQLGLHSQQSTGTQIISHYYLPPMLPTYHKGIMEQTTDINTDDDFCQAIHDFAPFREQPVINLPYPDPQPDNFLDFLYLVNPEENARNPDVREEYISSLHQLPEVRHFLPQDMNPEYIYFNTISGKSIETAEIAGFSVPVPNPSQPLRVENGHFLDSALPLLSIRKHTTFDGNAANAVSFVQRAEYRDNEPIMHFDLYDRSITRANYYAQDVHNRPDILVYTGYTPEKGVNDINRSSTVHSYKISKGTTIPNLNTPPETYYAWSSYRHLNPEASNTLPINQRLYMILNFRTLYGTNATMSQTIHPAELIPSA